LIKKAGVYPDPQILHKTEFFVAMHLIVCLTKRGLKKLPSSFPAYLFPTLDFTPIALVSSAFSIGALDGLQTTSYSVVEHQQELHQHHVSRGKIIETKALHEFLKQEIQHKQLDLQSLATVDSSQDQTLLSLQQSLQMIIQHIEQMGFPIPSNARRLDSFEDLENFVLKHIQSLKQEIQSMEISAKMLSVANEVSEKNTDAFSPVKNPLERIDALTKQLNELQQETTSLYEKKAHLESQLPRNSTTTTNKVSSGSMASPVIYKMQQH
jgi:D-ribose pyranose/furanose isomerase RbsD